MGKPLITDAQMLAMHRVLQTLQEATPRRSAAAARMAWSPALLTAALLQLHADDVLVTEGELPMASVAVASAQQGSFHADLQPLMLPCPRDSAAAVAAGHALAQSQGARPGDHAPLTLAMLSAQAPLADAMTLAGRYLLPLLLIVRDEPNRPRRPIVAPANVEVIPVDAEDTVAVCRVMQESTLRARNRWGAVVLRAVSLPSSADAMGALRAHLQRRGLHPAEALPPAAGTVPGESR